MRTIFGKKTDLPVGAYGELAAYRYEVFVKQLGWPLDCPPGQEADQFDRPDTEYVYARQDDGTICGCARLLPTHRPYLLGEVFPVLMHGAPMPQDAATWEVSRFATWAAPDALDADSGADDSLARTSQLVQAVLARARQLGARRLITVSPYGMERLLRRVGVAAHRVGPPVSWDGQLIIACWIDVP